MRLTFDYSLHDAHIVSVTIGPRRELRLKLDLRSARNSDERLPAAATLRLGAIANLEEVRKFFLRVGSDYGGTVYLGEIEGLTVRPGSNSSATAIFEIDPMGTLEVVCSKIELIPDATV